MRDDYYYENIWNNYYDYQSFCEELKYVIINYYYQTTEQVIVYYESNNSNYYDFYNSNSTDNNDSIGKKEIIEVNKTRNVSNYLYIDGILIK